MTGKTSDDIIASILNAMYLTYNNNESEKCDMPTKSNVLDFANIFEKQGENQREMLRLGMYNKRHCSDSTYKSRDNIEFPIDDIGLTSYHVQQLMSEVGELLDSDKRWKNFRNEKYDKSGKLEELVDCFIELMNIAMFSGFDAGDVYSAILKKLDIIKARIDENKSTENAEEKQAVNMYEENGIVVYEVLAPAEVGKKILETLFS